MTANRTFLFAHEKLDAYRVAREFLAIATEVARQMPRGEAAMRDQLERAASSIVLNIAEGAGRRPGREKARFFDLSRGSAAECAAILDVLALRSIAPAPLAERGRSLLHRSVGLLSGLSRSALRRSGGGP